MPMKYDFGCFLFEGVCHICSYKFKNKSISIPLCTAYIMCAQLSIYCKREARLSNRFLCRKCLVPCKPLCPHLPLHHVNTCGSKLR